MRKYLPLSGPLYEGGWNGAADDADVAQQVVVQIGNDLAGAAGFAGFGESKHVFVHNVCSLCLLFICASSEGLRENDALRGVRGGWSF